MRVVYRNEQCGTLIGNFTVRRYITQNYRTTTRHGFQNHIGVALVPAHADKAGGTPQPSPPIRLIGRYLHKIRHQRSIDFPFERGTVRPSRSRANRPQHASKKTPSARMTISSASHAPIGPQQVGASRGFRQVRSGSVSIRSMSGHCKSSEIPSGWLAPRQYSSPPLEFATMTRQTARGKAETVPRAKCLVKFA